MRRVRYRAASSLDGFIAGPDGEIDWIVPDPATSFTSLYAGFDTVLLGRRSYELTRQPGAPAFPVGWRIYVFSRTWRRWPVTRRHFQSSDFSIHIGDAHVDAIVNRTAFLLRLPEARRDD